MTGSILRPNRRDPRGPSRGFGATPGYATDASPNSECNLRNGAECMLVGPPYPEDVGLERTPPTPDGGVGNSLVVPRVSFCPGMLTEQQLAVLRASARTQRVATPISLEGVTPVTVTDAIGVTQAYVSDVARQRYSTTTVARTLPPFEISVPYPRPPARMHVIV